jgi:hypothetical protein
MKLCASCLLFMYNLVVQTTSLLILKIIIFTQHHSLIHLQLVYLDNGCFSTYYKRSDECKAWDKIEKTLSETDVAFAEINKIILKQRPVCDPRTLEKNNYGNWDGFVENGLEKNRANLVAESFSMNAFTEGTYNYTIISEDPGQAKIRRETKMTIDICLRICNTNNFVYAGLATYVI